MRTEASQAYDGAVTLEDAWAELHAATPPSSYVGTPVFHVERSQWPLYAFDTSEKAHIGQRSLGVDRGQSDAGGRGPRDNVPARDWQGEGAEVGY